MTSQHSDQAKIGVTVATIVGMNAMIGAGIFSVPAALASFVGPAGILTYTFVIIAVWCLGTSIARLAQLFPQEGSFYIYAKQWGGHTAGLLSAGSYLLGLLIAMGLLAQVAGTYLHAYFPFISSFFWGIILLCMLTLLNAFGVVLSEVGQIILICTTLFPLILTTIMCFTKANINNLFPFMPYGLTNVFAATRAVIFGFFGFECAASLFSIVKNPEKNVSRALTYAVSIVGVIYLLFVMSLILAVPLNLFSPTLPLSETLRIIFPHNRWIINCIHLSILSAIIGTVHSMIWSSSALLLSYFKQFKLPAIRNLAFKLRQQHTVLLVGLAIFLSFLLLKDINLFFSFTASFLIFTFTTSIITLLILPSERTVRRLLRTTIAITTATIIMYFALEGIVTSLQA